MLINWLAGFAEPCNSLQLVSLLKFLRRFNTILKAYYLFQISLYFIHDSRYLTVLPIKKSQEKKHPLKRETWKCENGKWKEDQVFMFMHCLFFVSVWGAFLILQSCDSMCSQSVIDFQWHVSWDHLSNDWVDQSITPFGKWHGKLACWILL